MRANFLFSPRAGSVRPASRRFPARPPARAAQTGGTPTYDRSPTERPIDYQEAPTVSTDDEELRRENERLLAEAAQAQREREANAQREREANDARRRDREAAERADDERRARELEQGS